MYKLSILHKRDERDNDNEGLNDLIVKKIEKRRG